MTITTNLTFEEYLKVMYAVAYKNWRVRFFTFIGLLILTSTIAVLFNKETKDFPYSSLIMGLGLAFSTPISLYFQLKKNYQANAALQQGVTYTFTKEGVELKGESFNSQLKWVNISKVVEQKEYFLLYPPSSTVMIVAKKELSDLEIKNFKQLLRGVNTIKLKLIA